MAFINIPSHLDGQLLAVYAKSKLGSGITHTRFMSVVLQIPRGAGLFGIVGHHTTFIFFPSFPALCHVCFTSLRGHRCIWFAVLQLCPGGIFLGTRATNNIGLCYNLGILGSAIWSVYFPAVKILHPSPLLVSASDKQTSTVHTLFCKSALCLVQNALVSHDFQLRTMPPMYSLQSFCQML